MGWKTYYKLDQSFFKTKYEKNEKWRELPPVRIIVDTTEYYAAGLASTGEASALGEKIRIQAYKARIKAKVILAFKAGTTASLGVYGVVYSNGNLISDDKGYNAWGVSFVLDVPQPNDVISFKEFIFELDGTKVTAYHDTTKDVEATLKLDGAQPVSFTLFLNIRNISGESPLAVVAIYELEAQYYDWIEDMINSLMGMFNMMFQIMLPLMIVMMVVGIITTIFRARREAKEEVKEVKEGAK